MKLRTHYGGMYACCVFESRYVVNTRAVPMILIPSPSRISDLKS